MFVIRNVKKTEVELQLPSSEHNLASKQATSTSTASLATF